MTRTTPDGRSVHDALAQQYDDFAVHRVLHEVPPHETYEVTVAGRRAVCKVATRPHGDPATEARVMAFVGRETSVPVPEVLAVGEGYFVAEWHPDASQAASLDGTKALAMGAGLATLHEETAGAFAASGRWTVGENGLTVRGRADWQAVVVDCLTDRRDYLETVGHADVADAVIDFLRAHPDSFDGAGEPILCHGNFLPDHVAVENGDLACVIDFEHALCGPAEYDCWRTLLPLSSNGDGDTVERFREGYESVRSLPPGFERRKDLYETVLTVSYLRSLYLQEQHDAEDTRKRAEWMREFVFDALDELEHGE
jgi:aminoglycoside phosphotransferase (APT) family kinase protein